MIWFLIVFSVGIFSLEMLLGSAHPFVLQTRVVDTVLLWLFVLEYVLRIVTYSPPELDLYDRSAVWQVRTHVMGRVVFAFSPLMLIDLVTILGLIPAFRALRALRFFRLLRGFRFFRYSNPLLGLLRGIQENAVLYVFILGGLSLIVVAFGAVFGVVEYGQNENVLRISDGIWWAIVTVTTVGYGDISPQTGIGKAIGVILMVVGMFTLAAFAGVVGNTLLKTLLQLRQDQFRMSHYVNHIVVCGYNESTPLLLRALLDESFSRRTQVLVFDVGDRPSDLPAELIWIEGDPTKESELDKVRLPFAASTIITGNRKLHSLQLADAVTILVAFTMRSYLAHQPKYKLRNKPIYIVAEILDTENIQHAHEAGVDEVIETTRIGYSLLAHAAFAHGSGAVLSDLAAFGAHSIWFAKRPLSVDATTFGELSLQIKSLYDATVIGFQSSSTSEVVFGPANSEPFRNQTIVYLAASPVLDDPMLEKKNN